MYKALDVRLLAWPHLVSSFQTMKNHFLILVFLVSSTLGEYQQDLNQVDDIKHNVIVKSCKFFIILLLHFMTFEISWKGLQWRTTNFHQTWNSPHEGAQSTNSKGSNSGKFPLYIERYDHVQEFKLFCQGLPNIWQIGLIPGKYGQIARAQRQVVEGSDGQ